MLLCRFVVLAGVTGGRVFGFGVRHVRCARRIFRFLGPSSFPHASSFPRAYRHSRECGNPDCRGRATHRAVRLSLYIASHRF